MDQPEYYMNLYLVECNLTDWYDISPTKNVEKWTLDNCNSTEETSQSRYCYEIYLDSLIEEYNKALKSTWLYSFFQLPLQLFMYYYIIHIGIALCAIVILVSIFSRIKEHYRWLILNQTISHFISTLYTCTRYFCII